MTLKYLSIFEAADLCGIPYENFRYHVNKNRIPVAALQGKKKLFLKEEITKCELVKLLKKRKRK